ncbi:MAG: Ig-like domain-containing protein, partial [Gemmatimonadaceae bacterium]
MLAISKTALHDSWGRIFSRAAIALVAIAVGCGGSSDVTAPPGGGGGGVGPTPVATVAVTATSAALLVGVTDSATLGTSAIAATPEDANGNALSGRAITWSSTSTGVATVNSSGVVTAVGAGTAMITATSEGKSGQISVTVTRPAVSTVTVTQAAATLLVGVVDSTNLGSTTLTAVAKDANGHQLSGRAVA